MTELCKLFIGGLSVATDNDGLRKHFEQFGTLIDHVVIRHKLQSRSRCFGFVTYSKPEEADAAMAARPHTVEGYAVEVKRAVPKTDAKNPEAPANATVKKIFVGGLKNNIEEDHLSDYFSQFGQVEKSEIMSDMETGKKRGFGFVHFTHHGSADKAVVEKFHTVRGHRVEVKKAVAKQDMQAGNRTGTTPRVMPSQDVKANQNGYSGMNHGGYHGYGTYGYENGGYQGYNGPFDQGSFYSRNYGYGNGGGYGGYGGYSSSYRCFNCGQENGYSNFGAPYNRGYGGY